jgi:hypothetical protein
MNESNENQKIIINSLILKKAKYSIEFYLDQFHLDILINEKISSKFSSIKFNKFDITYIIDLKIPFQEQLDTIEFKLCSEKNNIPLYKGNFSTLPSDLNKKGVFEYDCDIRNSKKEKICINFKYINNQVDNLMKRSITFQKEQKEDNSNEIFNNYNNYLDEIKKEKQELDKTIKRVSASNNIKSDVSLLELARGKNAITFNNFVRNVDYIKAILNFILDLIFWKEPYKTFSILSFMTFIILYTNFFILILSIFLIILFHLSYRDSFEENFSFKNVSRDYSSNLQIIMWIMEFTNDSFLSLENLISKLQNNSKELFKEVYINLLKLLFFNITLYIVISYASKSINIKYLVVVGLWFFFLMQYPPFKAFLMILKKLIISLINDFYNIGDKKREKKLLTNEKLNYFLEIIIPFYRLAKEINSEDGNNAIKKINSAPEIVIVPDINDNNKLKQMLKYEIYEKQRWKIMIWSDDLKKEDGANWVKKGDNKNIYFDKNQIILPGKDYVWKNDWEIEISNNTDKDGWEYAKTFDDDIWQRNGKNCLVRRRKWIKYACLK